MVIVLVAQAAVTPAGKPVAALIPVAPVVAMVTGVKTVLMHIVGLAEGAEAVLAGLTVMVPVALTAPHPPVSGME